MDEGTLRFDDRAILITGAGRGLGRAHAVLLASRGAKVLVADNGAAMNGGGGAVGPAQDVVVTIRTAGGNAVAYTADLSLEKGAHEAVAATPAGVAETRPGLLASCRDSQGLQMGTRSNVLLVKLCCLFMPTGG